MLAQEPRGPASFFRFFRSFWFQKKNKHVIHTNLLYVHILNSVYDLTDLSPTLSTHRLHEIKLNIFGKDNEVKFLVLFNASWVRKKLSGCVLSKSFTLFDIQIL